MQKAEATPQQPAESRRDTASSPTAEKASKDEAEVIIKVHTQEMSMSTYPTRDTHFFADSQLMKDIREKPWLPVPGADF